MASGTSTPLHGVPHTGSGPVIASGASGAHEASYDATVDVARILVVDGDDAFLRRAESLGRGFLIEVIAARTAVEAVMRARAMLPDAAIIDADLDDALSLAHTLRGLPGGAGLPLAFTAGDDIVEDRVREVHAGASLLLHKPLSADGFAAAVRQLTLARAPERPHVLVVDDDEDVCAWLAEVLVDAGIDASVVTDPGIVLSDLERLRPDLVILDAAMPRVNGFDVCRMLRADPRWQELPVLFLTGASETNIRVAAFRAGADDFLAKPVSSDELLARVCGRIERARLHRELAEKDPLTGLLLRRSFLAQVGARLAEARRLGRVLSLCLMDMDNFKRINDQHGHLAGDRVLAALGDLMARRFRAEDVRGRWGGEEFAVALPGPPGKIETVVARVLAELASMPFRGDLGELFHAFFSAGVASFPADGDTVEDLLRTADHRLYRAKTLGRGRVIARD